MDGQKTQSQHVLAWMLTAWFCFLPFVFFPNLSSPFTTPKLIGFLTIATLGLGMVFIRSVVRKKITISQNPFIIIFIPVLLTTLYTLVVVSKNHIEALLEPLGIISWIGLLVSLAFLSPRLDRVHRQTLRWFFGIVSGVLGLLSIYQLIGIPSIFSTSIPFLADPFFTPFGSPLEQIICSLLLIPNLVSLIHESHRTKNESAKVVSMVCVVLVSIGTIATMIRSFDTIQSSLMPLSIAWSLTLEVWKHAGQAIQGVGLERYLPTYLLYRPEEINTTSLWNAGFSYAPTMVLHTAVTEGLIGILGLIGTVVLSIKSITSHTLSYKRTVYAMLPLLFWLISLAITPPFLSTTILLTMLLITYDETEPISIGVKPPGMIAITILVLPILIGSGMFIVQESIAEYRFSMVTTYAQSGNTAAAYNEMIHVITAMPTISKYHITMSQLTVRALQALLASATSEKAHSLSQSDTALLSTLANQAVSEARRASLLSPDNALMWSNVARTYQALIGSAQNADQYTIASYRQAIQLDPVNPTLHMDLGVIFASLKQYPEAVKEILTALTLKPNYSNALFNLANIYRIKGDYDSAKGAIKQLKVLIANDQKSQNQVQDLEHQITTDETQSTTTQMPTPSLTPTPNQ